MQREVSLNACFTSYMPPELGFGQEPEIKSESPRWVAEPQALGPSAATWQGVHTEKAGIGSMTKDLYPGTLVWDVGNPTGILIAVPGACPCSSLLILTSHERSGMNFLICGIMSVLRKLWILWYFGFRMSNGSIINVFVVFIWLIVSWAWFLHPSLSTWIWSMSFHYWTWRGFGWLIVSNLSLSEAGHRELLNSAITAFVSDIPFGGHLLLLSEDILDPTKQDWMVAVSMVCQKNSWFLLHQ